MYYQNLKFEIYSREKLGIGCIPQHVIKTPTKDSFMILVTGASGLIGSAIYDKVNKHYDTVGCCYKNWTRKEFVSYNLSSSIETKHLMETYKPDCVIHCAATPNPVPDFENPNKIIRKNISTTNNLLTYAPQGCKFIFMSSIVVYGDCEYPKAIEDELNPKSVYAATKVASEALVNSFHNMGLIEGFIVRLGATIGPNAKRGIIYDFIKKLKSDSKNLEVFGSYPGSIKPYTHVEDVAELVRKLVLTYYKREDKARIINCANKDSVPVSQIAQIVMNELDIYKFVEFNNKTWLGDNKELWVDTSDSEKMYGFKPKYNSREAIKEVVREWINR